MGDLQVDVEALHYHEERRKDYILVVGILFISVVIAAYLLVTSDVSLWEDDGGPVKMVERGYHPPERVSYGSDDSAPLKVEPKGVAQLEETVTEAEPDAAAEIETTPTVEAMPVEPQPAVVEIEKPVNAFAWAVNLVSLTDAILARDAVDQLRRQGEAAEYVEVSKGGRTYYRVRIGNLESRDAADLLLLRIKDNPSYRDAWINRYRL